MIQLGQKVEAVPEQPLEHLVSCHRRILHRLETLERIGGALASDPGSALPALRNTLRFFDVTARLHTEDEEQSVFPRLRGRLSPEDLAYVDSLESQHREKEAVYAELKDLAAELDSEVTAARVARYHELTGRLCALYRTHIASEDDVLVRLGRGVLEPDELVAIREEMGARRG